MTLNNLHKINYLYDNLKLMHSDNDENLAIMYFKIHVFSCHFQ